MNHQLILGENIDIIKSKLENSRWPPQKWPKGQDDLRTQGSMLLIITISKEIYFS